MPDDDDDDTNTDMSILALQQRAASKRPRLFLLFLQLKSIASDV
jgi:hypothetical protein